MKKFIATISIIFLLLLVLTSCGEKSKHDLVIFAGAGLIKPMTDLISSFEEKEDIKINIHYGSSGEIFGMVAAGQYCDILIPGAEKYTEDALKNGWLIENSTKKLVLHIPTIVVPKGNPANIKCLEDLTKPNVKVAIGDPKGPAIGRVTKKLLMKNKLWEAVNKNVTVKGPTVNQLLIYPALGQVDAAIVWSDITEWAEDKGKVESISIDPKKNIIMTIPTSITTQSKSKKLAEKFNNFMLSNEGMKIWGNWGFQKCEK